MEQVITNQNTAPHLQKSKGYIVLQNITIYSVLLKICDKGFPGGPVVRNLPCNAGDIGSTPGPERFHMPRGN